VRAAALAAAAVALLQAAALAQPARVVFMSLSGSGEAYRVEVFTSLPVEAERTGQEAGRSVWRLRPAHLSAPLRHSRGQVAVSASQAGPAEVEVSISHPAGWAGEAGAGRTGVTFRVGPAAAHARPGQTPQPGAASEEITLRKGHGTLLRVPGLVRVMVANPKVADVAVVSASEVVLTAVDVGETTLFLWGAGGLRRHTVRVVAADPSASEAAAEMIRAMAPTVQVSQVGSALVLSGQVDTQLDRQRLVRAAQAAVKESKLEVVDLLEVRSPVQVRLEVRVAEIGITDVRSLGVTLGMLTPEGQALPQGVFAWLVSGGILQPVGDLLAQITALVQAGKARVLAAPNVVTESGQEARIVVGGQLPVPGGGGGQQGQQGGGGVEFRPFGVVLNATPEVTASGAVRMKLDVSNSELDFSRTVNVQGSQLPTIIDRSVRTTVVMRPGDSLVLGGLVSHVTQEVVRKFPILGDLPVIGELFRSREFQERVTEAVFVVTPMVLPWPPGGK
jgi:pilus assembly protein CpaC